MSKNIINNFIFNIFKKEPYDLDELLPAIGEFGRYQKLLVWFICLPACIPCGFCAFNQLFMAETPEDYWCRIPALENFSIDDRKMLGIPVVEDVSIEMFWLNY